MVNGFVNYYSGTVIIHNSREGSVAAVYRVIDVLVLHFLSMYTDQCRQFHNLVLMGLCHNKFTRHSILWFIHPQTFNPSHYLIYGKQRENMINYFVLAFQIALPIATALLR